MKVNIKIVRQLVAICTLIVPMYGVCGSSHCYNIKEQDNRLLCTAIARHDVVQCNQISYKDGVNHCKAMTMISSGFCKEVSLGNRPHCLINVQKYQRQFIMDPG